MQVARIHEHGDPAVLRVEEIDAPEPGPGEVLVRVLGVSVNHLDLWVRRGMPGVEIPMPRILGCDGAGEVVALGDGVDDLAVGARVVIEPGFSSGESAHDRGIVAIHSVSRKFLKMCEDPVYIIDRVRPLRMACQLSDLPGIQRCKDVTRQFPAFSLKTLDFALEIKLPIDIHTP